MSKHNKPDNRFPPEARLHSRRLYTRVALTAVAIATISIAASPRGALAAASPLTVDGADIIINASDVTTLNGHWSKQASADAAASTTLTTPDEGWATTEHPLAEPTNFFEATFEAPANTPYRVWLRLRATGDSKWNDSVWVQFGNARHNDGSAAYPIGTTRGLLVNLALCSKCRTADWGWFNGAYWLQQRSVVSFASTGPHTIRVQTREDGVEIDQIVLSPVRFLANAPGPVLNDTTTVSPATGAIVAPAQVSTPSPSAPAFGAISAPGGNDAGGVAIALPNPVPQAPPPPAPTPTPTPTPTAPAPPSGTAGGSFRMMTWNVQHGRTKAKAYDPAAQAKFIADQNPQVVALQEVQTWDENQPARYKALLEQYTGATWHMQWAPVNGRAGTEGNVLLTRLPVASSSYYQMHATGDHDAIRTRTDRRHRQPSPSAGSGYMCSRRTLIGTTRRIARRSCST